MVALHVAIGLCLSVSPASAFSSAPGKHYLMVTGGTRGIGRQACEYMVQAIHRDPSIDAAMWTVVITGRTEEGARAAATKLLDDLPGERRDVTVYPLVLDVADPSSRDAAVKTLSSLVGEEGNLHALVNNAGVGLDMPWNPPCPPETEGDVAHQTMSVNLLGPLALTVALITAGVLRKGSRVVNVSAGTGHVALWRVKEEYRSKLLDDGLTVTDVESMGREIIETAQSGGKKALDKKFGYSYIYGLSKLCFTMATKAMAAEYPELIVHACNPGFIKTDMTKGSAAALPPAKGADVVVHCATSRLGPALQSGKGLFQPRDEGMGILLAWDDESLRR